MEKVTITFLKHEKFNPRKDYKHPTWFALSNSIMEDPDYIEFSPLEFKALIYLFCQASKKKWAPVDIVFKHAKKLFDIDQKTLMSVIENLVENQTVQMSVRIPYGICTESERDPNVTDRQTDRQEDRQTIEPAAQFDFDAIAKKYPKPKGPDAEKRFRDQIKTQQDYDELNSALTHYLAMLALPENEWRRPKQTLAAFLGTRSSGYFWRDYIHPDSCKPTFSNKAAARLSANPADHVLGAARAFWQKYNAYSEPTREQILEVFGDEETMRLYFKAGGRKLATMHAIEQRKAIEAALSNRGAA